MKRKKTVLNIISLIICLHTITSVPLACHADNDNNDNDEEAKKLFLNGVVITQSEMGSINNYNNLFNRINLIITVVYGLIGVIFFILIIYGGILWMTAGGNDTQVKKAQNSIQRAAIGLLIVVLAYAITYFILSVVFNIHYLPSSMGDYYITT
jgi:amino acid transporter